MPTKQELQQSIVDDLSAKHINLSSEELLEKSKAIELLNDTSDKKIRWYHSNKYRDYKKFKITDSKLWDIHLEKYWTSWLYWPTRLVDIDNKMISISNYHHPTEYDRNSWAVKSRVAVTYAGASETNQYLQYAWGCADNGTHIAMVSYNHHFVKVWTKEDWLSNSAKDPAYTFWTFASAQHLTWTPPGLYYPRDIITLPNGNWLVASYHGNNDTQTNNQGFLSEWDNSWNLVACRVANSWTADLIDLSVTNPSRIQLDPDDNTKLYVGCHGTGLTKIDMSDWSIEWTKKAIDDAWEPLIINVFAFNKIPQSLGWWFLVSSSTNGRSLIKLDENKNYLWHINNYEPHSYSSPLLNPLWFNNIYDMRVLDGWLIAVLDTSSYALKVFPAPDRMEWVNAIWDMKADINDSLGNQLTDSNEWIVDWDTTIDYNNRTISLNASKVGKLANNNNEIEINFEK